MKNETIVNSWDKIEPNPASEARMLASILARNPSKQSEKGGLLGRRRAVLITISLLLLVSFVGLLGSNAGWFGAKIYTADLGDGNTLVFYRTPSNEASFAWDIDWGSALSVTVDESAALFGDLPVSGDAIFRSVDGAFLHFEGRAGDVKLSFSASGFPVTDTPIEGNESASLIDGVPVSAGYFLTDANSQGLRNLLLFATFSANDMTFLVEHGGAEADGEALRDELALVVGQLVRNTANGMPNMSAIRGT